MSEQLSPADLEQLVANIPYSVIERKREVEKLIADYPVIVPDTAMAEFMRMDVRALRAALQAGTDFGYAWKRNRNFLYYIDSNQVFMRYIEPWLRAGLARILPPEEPDAS